MKYGLFPRSSEGATTRTSMFRYTDMEVAMCTSTGSKRGECTPLKSTAAN